MGLAVYEIKTKKRKSWKINSSRQLNGLLNELYDIFTKNKFDESDKNRINKIVNEIVYRTSEEAATKLILKLLTDIARIEDISSYSLETVVNNLILLKGRGVDLNVLGKRPKILEILKYPTEKIKARLNELRFLQVKNIEKVITESPELLIVPYENIKRFIDCLKEFGIGIGIGLSIGEIIKNYPQLITKYKPEDIRDKLKYLLYQLWIDVRTIEKNLHLLEYDIKEMDDRIEYLKKPLGINTFYELNDEDRVKLVTLPEDEFNDFTKELIKKYSKKKNRE
jgi:hypothetical protein